MHHFLSTWPKTPDIISVSETRLINEPLINILLPGYDFIHANSKTTAGGVAMYISNNISFKINQTVKNCDLALSIKLAQLNSQNDKYFLQGNFNVHVTANKHENYLNQLSSCGAFQVITLPTRVTSSTSTIIDSNKRHLRLCQAWCHSLIQMDRTDHYVTSCSIQTYNRSNKTFATVERDSAVSVY